MNSKRMLELAGITEAKNPLEGVQLFTIRIGDTAFVFDKSQKFKIHKKADAALQRGVKITWEDRTEQWMVKSEILNKGKSGSAAYTWNKNGNKVKGNLVLYTKTSGGKLTSKTVKQIWMNP